MKFAVRHPIALSTAGALAIVALVCAWASQAGTDAPPAAGGSTSGEGASGEGTHGAATDQRPATSIPGYDLAHPISSFTLPAELTEISALTDIDDDTIACVQDEIGTVFFVDLSEGVVTREVPFGADGDYEGLTRVDDALWVLRSDGLLIELAMRGDALDPGRRVQLDLEHRDIEGLGYDPVARFVLVAPKSSVKGDKAERARRRVFRFDPTSGGRLDGFALDTTIDRIVSDAEQAGIALPTKTNKRGRKRVDLQVRFASIAVQPQTGRLFALSAVDRALLVFTREGRLTAARLLHAPGWRYRRVLQFDRN